MGKEHDPVRELLAQNIKTYRLVLGLTQEKLSEKCGLAMSMIASIETCAKFPSSKSLEKLSRALHVEVHELFKPQEGEGREVLSRLYDLAVFKKSLISEVNDVMENRFRAFQTNAET